MKPKIWNPGDPAAQNVALGKLRGLDRVDTPYLRASGPGFDAFKRGDFRQIDLQVDAISDATYFLATSDYVQGHVAEDGTSERSRIGVRPGKFINFRQNIDGLYAGRGCGYAAHQAKAKMDKVEKECLLVIRNENPPPEAPVYETVERSTFAYETPWSLFALPWGRSFSLPNQILPINITLSGVEFQAPSDLSPGMARVAPVGWDDRGYLHLAMAITYRREGVTDDYDFPVVAPAVFYIEVNKEQANARAFELPIPNDTTGVHSYGVGTFLTTQPGECILMVAEYFQPQRYRFDEALNPKNPRGRLLMYRIKGWGASFDIREVQMPEEVFSAQPSPSTLSAPIDDPSMPRQDVAYRATLFDNLLNRQLLDFVGGSGITVSPGVSVWFASVRRSASEFVLYAFRIEGDVVSHQAMPVPASATQQWVDSVNIKEGVAMARVRASRYGGADNQVTLLVTRDVALSWSVLPAQGLPSPMTNANVGVPSVSRIKKDGSVVVFLPVRESSDEQGVSVIMQSNDGALTWRKAGSMAKLTQASTFIPNARDWAQPTGGVVDANYDSSYMLGYGRVAVVRDSAGRLMPSDPICPWVLDSQYKVPQ